MKPETGTSWLLIAVGLATIAGAAWGLRSAWLGRSASTGSVPGKRLLAGAGALVFMGAGVATVLLGVGHGAAPAASPVSLTVWAAAALLGLTGLAVRVREQHQDRALRRGLGLSTKRRRLNPLLVGFMVCMGVAMLGIAGLVLWLTLQLQPGKPAPQISQNSILAVAGTAFVCGIIAATVQARRRVARDREIQNSARAVTGQPVLDPPRWPHQVAVDAWRELKIRWLRPCAPEQALETVFTGAAQVIIGGLLAWLFIAATVQPATRLPDQMLGFCLALGALVAGVISTAYVPAGGLINAIQHLTGRRPAPGTPEDE